MKATNKKAQIGFETAQSIVIGLFLIGILIFGIIFFGSKLKTEVDDRQTFTNRTERINLSGGSSNPTVTLGAKDSTNPDVICESLTGNTSIIPFNLSTYYIHNANFTFSGGSACTIRWNDNSSSFQFNHTDFNVSYDYSRLKDVDSVNAINNTNIAFGTMPPLFTTVAIFGVLFLIFGVVFLFFRMFGSAGGSSGV